MLGANPPQIRKMKIKSLLCLLALTGVANATTDPKLSGTFGPDVNPVTYSFHGANLFHSSDGSGYYHTGLLTIQVNAPVGGSVSTPFGTVTSSTTVLLNSPGPTGSANPRTGTYTFVFHKPYVHDISRTLTVYWYLDFSTASLDGSLYGIGHIFTYDYYTAVMSMSPPLALAKFPYSIKTNDKLNHTCGFEMMSNGASTGNMATLSQKGNVVPLTKSGTLTLAANPGDTWRIFMDDPLGNRQVIANVGGVVDYTNGDYVAPTTNFEFAKGDDKKRGFGTMHIHGHNNSDSSQLVTIVQGDGSILAVGSVAAYSDYDFTVSVYGAEGDLVSVKVNGVTVGTSTLPPEYTGRSDGGSGPIVQGGGNYTAGSPPPPDPGTGQDPNAPGGSPPDAPTPAPPTAPSGYPGSPGSGSGGTTGSGTGGTLSPLDIYSAVLAALNDSGHDTTSPDSTPLGSPTDTATEKLSSAHSSGLAIIQDSASVGTTFKSRLASTSGSSSLTALTTFGKSNTYALGTFGQFGALQLDLTPLQSYLPIIRAVMLLFAVIAFLFTCYEIILTAFNN